MVTTPLFNATPTPKTAKIAKRRPKITLIGEQRQSAVTLTGDRRGEPPGVTAPHADRRSTRGAPGVTSIIERASRRTVTSASPGSSLIEESSINVTAPRRHSDRSPGTGAPLIEPGGAHAHTHARKGTLSA